MSQILSGHVFVPLEKNIDDVKLNSVISGATITSELISTQTLSTSAVTGDQFLVLKSGGTLARILYDDLATSLGSASGMVGAITSVRLRSFNALGGSNPTFEVDQRNADGSSAVTANAIFVLDRWIYSTVGTMVISSKQTDSSTSPILVPGTNFGITRKFLRMTLTTQEATLAGGDWAMIYSTIEGPSMRELISDVSSLQLLVRSSVAGLKFSASLRNGTGSAYSINYLCTIPNANTWVLIALPNIPSFASSGMTWNLSPGNAGYIISINLACGTTNTTPANSTWQAGNYFGAAGQSNFAASPIGSTFDIAFIQHEPGPLCTTLIDKPFAQNYDECLRYFQKTYPYTQAIGSTNVPGAIQFIAGASLSPVVPVRYYKPLARNPTTTLYSYATGAANNVRDANASVDRAVSAVNTAAETGYGGATCSTTNASVWNAIWHHTADTGW